MQSTDAQVQDRHHLCPREMMTSASLTSPTTHVYAVNMHHEADHHTIACAWKYRCYRG
jgi:hypothetical protein